MNVVSIHKRGGRGEEVQLHIYVLKRVNSGRKSLVVCLPQYVRMRMGRHFVCK